MQDLVSILAHPYFFIYTLISASFFLPERLPIDQKKLVIMNDRYEKGITHETALDAH